MELKHAWMGRYYNASVYIACQDWELKIHDPSPYPCSIKKGTDEKLLTSSLCTKAG